MYMPLILLLLELPLISNSLKFFHLIPILLNVFSIQYAFFNCIVLDCCSFLGTNNMVMNVFEHKFWRAYP